MPALAPDAHLNLEYDCEFYGRSQTEAIAEIVIGDSRSAATRFRRQSQMARCMDVDIASVFIPMDDTVGPQMWKDGYGLGPIALTGVANNYAEPSQTLPQASIVNRLPISLREIVCTSGGTNPQAGRALLGYMTYGGAMNSSNVDGSTGGNAKRGRPYGAGGILNVEAYRVSTDASVGADMRINAGQYSGAANETNIGTSGTMGAPPAAAAGEVRITSQVWTPTPTAITAGNNIAFNYAFVSQPAVGAGAILAGLRIRFRNTGYTYYDLSVGGDTTLHALGPTVAGIANTRYRWTDEGLRQFLRSVITENVIRWRINLGQNSPQSGLDPDALLEWDGTNTNRYEANLEEVLLRILRITAEPEFAGKTHYFGIDSVWYPAGSRAKQIAQRDCQRRIVQKYHRPDRPVIFYDEVATLEALYVESGGTQGLDDSVGLLPANVGDPIHQNYDRVIVLGNAYAREVLHANRPVALARGLGAAPDMPPTTWTNYTPSDVEFTPFVTTYVRADVGGVLPVVWADGTVEEIQDFPTQRAVAMRVKAILANNTTAEGIQIGT